MDEDEVEIQQLKDRLAEAEARRADRLRTASLPIEPRKSVAKPKLNPFLVAVPVAVVVGLIWVSVTSNGSGNADPAKGPTNTPTATQARIAAEIAAAGSPADQVDFSRWIYTDDRDPMTDRMTRVACVTSTNLVQLSSPYDPVPARLCVRSSPRHGLDAYVALMGDGQIICRTYSGCSTKVRFGDRPVQTFSATDAADGSSNIMFIVNAARMVEGLKSADVTRVELTLYQDGVQPIEFPTKDLEWPRPETP